MKRKDFGKFGKIHKGIINIDKKALYDIDPIKVLEKEIGSLRRKIVIRNLKITDLRKTIEIEKIINNKTRWYNWSKDNYKIIDLRKENKFNEYTIRKYRKKIDKIKNS